MFWRILALGVLVATLALMAMMLLSSGGNF